MAPSLCEVCGRVYCDHSQWERDLNDAEWDKARNRELTPQEQAAWDAGDDAAKVAAARQAHKQFTGRHFHSLEGFRE